MKEKLIEIIKDLEQQIEKYTKNPNHKTASGLLTQKAQPKYCWLRGKLDAYKTALAMLEKEDQ